MIKLKKKKYLNKGWSDFVAILNCVIGIAFIFLVAFLLSNNKKKINWRTVIIGFLIQFGFALAALKWSVGKYVLSKVALGVQSVIDYAKEGISFLFGSLANDGSIFAVNVLGVIIFISAIVSVLILFRNYAICYKNYRWSFIKAFRNI